MSAMTAVAASVTTGMAWVGRQRFPMGSDLFGPEERPAHEAEVAGFWIDPSPVTNAEFADFVADTGYLTVAERERPGACRHRPTGPGSSLDGLAQQPVVHIAHADAEADSRRHPGGEGRLAAAIGAPGTTGPHGDGRPRVPLCGARR